MKLIYLSSRVFWHGLFFGSDYSIDLKGILLFLPCCCQADWIIYALHYKFQSGIMTDRVQPKNPAFGLWKWCCGEMGLRKVEQGFSSFFTNFFRMNIRWFFKVDHAPKIATKLRKIIIYAKNLAKNEEKPCSICLSTHFSADYWYPKIRFRIPNPSLVQEPAQLFFGG